MPRSPRPATYLKEHMTAEEVDAFNKRLLAGLTMLPEPAPIGYRWVRNADSKWQLENTHNGD